MRLPVCGARLRLTPSCLLRRSLKTGDQGPRGMIRRVFAELDEDNSGFMNKEEFKKLVAKCGGRKRKLKEITEIFSRLDDGDDGTPGQISFKVFETWFVEEMKSDVRAARVLARQLFTLSDSDDSGTLDKAEFGKIAAHLSSKFPQIVLEPDFDLQNDWEKMTKMAADAQVGAQPLQTTARPFLLTVSNPSLSAAPHSWVGEKGQSTGLSRLVSAKVCTRLWLSSPSPAHAHARPAGQGNIPEAVTWDDFERWWRDRCASSLAS